MKKIIILLLAGFALFACSCNKTPLNSTQVISFKDAGPLNGVANNFNTVTLTASVPGDSDPQTQVVFTTDLGTFLNSNSNTITVSTNTACQAIAYLKSSTSGTATVKATVLTTYSAIVMVNFSTPVVDSIFTIAPYTDNIVADGATSLILTAAINKHLPPAAQSVIFTADNSATFSNGNATATVNVDGTGNATAFLHSSLIGPVHVTVADGSVNRVLTVNFVQSLPDRMLITGQASLTSGFSNSMPIAISLIKNTGKPSSGLLFNYLATDSMTNTVGTFFSGTASDTNGNSTVSFTMGNSMFKGSVTITVSLQQNPAIKAIIIVQII